MVDSIIDEKSLAAKVNVLEREVAVIGKTIEDHLISCNQGNTLIMKELGDIKGHYVRLYDQLHKIREDMAAENKDVIKWQRNTAVVIVLSLVAIIGTLIIRSSGAV